jgi:hypothetical protein
MSMTSEDIMEMYFKLEQWHEDQSDKLKSIINKKADIKFQAPSGEVVDLNKHDAVMFRMGVQVALSFFEKLPIKLKGALPEVSD